MSSGEPERSIRLVGWRRDDDDAWGYRLVLKPPPDDEWWRVFDAVLAERSLLPVVVGDDGATLSLPLGRAFEERFGAFERAVSEANSRRASKSADCAESARRPMLEAVLVVVYLAVWIIGCTTAIAVLLSDDDLDVSEQLVALSIVGGALGSAISALLSAAERIANGWELADGTKLPKREPPDKFVARMTPFFLVRPLIGGATGLMVYAGVVGGFLIVTETSLDLSDFSPEGLTFLAFLGGLFAKTFLERLRDTFSWLFGGK